MRHALRSLHLPRHTATSHARRWAVGTVFVAVTALAGACDARAPRESAATTGVIDSALPIPVLLERFRAATTDTPTVLRGGAERPEALVRALLAAVSARDTSTLRSLVMSRAEFAWLYYPHTKYIPRPYELGPSLMTLSAQRSASKRSADPPYRSSNRTAPVSLPAVCCIQTSSAPSS